jgi:type II secretory pathway component PulF
MPRYRASFVDRRGRKRTLTLDSTDRESLAEHLAATRGAHMIGAQRLAKGGRNWRSRLPTPVMLAAFDSLELMLLSGVRINLALRTLATCAPEGPSRGLWTDLVERVEETGRFGESLRAFPREFNGAIAGVIEAHELAGRLPDGVRHARDYAVQMREIRRDSLRGLAYPALVLATGLLASAVLCFYTLPRFSKMLADIGVTRTNPITAFFFGLSAFVNARPWVVPVVLSMPLLLAFAASRPRFRSLVDRALLQVPLVRGAVEALCMARVCVTYRALSESGIRVVEALETAAAAAGNSVYRGGILAVASAVRDNATVGDGFQRAGIFSSEVIVAVRSAEGSLPLVFGRLAEYYSRESRHRVALAIGMIEPAMLAFVLSWVLVITLAVVLPVVEVLNGIR